MAPESRRVASDCTTAGRMGHAGGAQGTRILLSLAHGMAPSFFKLPFQVLQGWEEDLWGSFDVSVAFNGVLLGI